MSYQTHVTLRISKEPGAVPTSKQLGEGELAFNLTDRVLYTRFGDKVEPVNMTSEQRDRLAQVGTMANRAVYISDQPPDNAIGSDGDVWLQHWS